MPASTKIAVIAALIISIGLHVSIAGIVPQGKKAKIEGSADNSVLAFGNSFQSLSVASQAPSVSQSNNVEHGKVTPVKPSTHKQQEPDKAVRAPVSPTNARPNTYDNASAPIIAPATKVVVAHVEAAAIEAVEVTKAALEKAETPEAKPTTATVAAIAPATPSKLQDVKPTSTPTALEVAALARPQAHANLAKSLTINNPVQATDTTSPTTEEIIPLPEFRTDRSSTKPPKKQPPQKQPPKKQPLEKTTPNRTKNTSGEVTSHGNSNQNAKLGKSSGKKSGKSANTKSSNSASKNRGNASASNYQGLVQRKVARTRGKRASKKGAVRNPRVSFKINANGHIIGIRVSNSSGSKEVDSAALDKVKRSAPFPPPPPGAPRSFGIRVKL